MIIAIGCDHIGLELKESICEVVSEFNYEYLDFGTYSSERTDYPKYAFLAGNAVASGKCDLGILICGTGIGVSIVANKIKGIRCAVCSEPYSAKLSKEHNNTNMLALGSRVVGSELAKMIVREWLSADFDGERHQRRVNMISQIETKTVEEMFKEE